MVDQICRPGAAPIKDGLLERIEDKIGAQRRGDPPPDNAAGEDIDHEGDIDKAAPCRHVREVGDPQLIRPRRVKATIDEIGRAVGCRVRMRGNDPCPSAADAFQPHVPHQALDGATRHPVAFAAQLLPHLPRSIDVVVVVPYALNRRAPLGIPLRPRRSRRRICPLCLPQEIGGRSDGQDRTDRLDP